ncbi:MAG TPA: hypothetical protein VND89_06485 [Acidimicrobiales bacterium]|nr:hypothetical protein [Acidimicrobiales bacterium]
MTIGENLDELLTRLDPLSQERQNENEVRREAIWSDVVRRSVAPRPHPLRRRLIGAGSLTTVVVAALVLAGALPGSSPVNAAAAELTTAAHADAASAVLPTLGVGQYYYQKSAVSMVCSFSSPSMPSGQSLMYDSVGTMESWTSSDGSGKVAITPSPVDANGSHFVTPEEQAQWLADGSPFIPCALGSAANSLGGNRANANPGQSGGFVESVVGFGGFGFFLGPNTVSEDLASGTSVNNLPTNVAQISAMLANGEINLDGSVSSVPQACPGGGGTNPPIGCATYQELAVIEQLLQLPDASAKFGSVLYQVMAAMPGASIEGATTDSFGRAGEGIVVPGAQDEELQVVLNPTTGALLSCSELTASNTNGALSQTSSTPYLPSAQMTYGTVSVVQGVGTLPKAR